MTKTGTEPVKGLVANSFSTNNLIMLDRKSVKVASNDWSVEVDSVTSISMEFVRVEGGAGGTDMSVEYI